MFESVQECLRECERESVCVGKYAWVSGIHTSLSHLRMCKIPLFLSINAYFTLIQNIRISNGFLIYFPSRPFLYSQKFGSCSNAVYTEASKRKDKSDQNK